MFTEYEEEQEEEEEDDEFEESEEADTSGLSAEQACPQSAACSFLSVLHHAPERMIKSILAETLAGPTGLLASGRPVREDRRCTGGAQGECAWTASLPKRFL